MVQVPLDPENFDKVNYIIEAWARPCNAPWYIYVEALKPALLTAFITLITFGWDDVARGYFRPRGLGRRTGKRKGRGKAGRLRGIPEFGDLIGKNLPGAEEIKGEKWSNLGKTLWRIDSRAQLTLFFWLVADVTEDLAFNFTSVLYETVWCQASTLGRFSYQSAEFRTIPGNSWWNMSFETEDYEFPPPTWLFTSGLSGFSGCLAAAGINFKKNPSFPAPLTTQIRLVERLTGRVFHQSGPAQTDVDGESRVPISGNIPPNVRFQVQAWHDADWADAGAGFVTGMQNED